MAWTMLEKCKKCNHRDVLGCHLIYRCAASNGEENNMSNAMTVDKERRENELQERWMHSLPCYTCDMADICRHVNTFRKIDYNADIFEVTVKCKRRNPVAVSPSVMPKTIQTDNPTNVSSVGSDYICGNRPQQFADSSGEQHQYENDKTMNGSTPHWR